jgi:hypothetical protein
MAHFMRWPRLILANRILEQHLLDAEKMVGSNGYDETNLWFVQQRLDE